MNIVLAERRSKVRSAMRTLLEQNEDLHIVGEASDADQVAGILDSSCPDLILLDWELCSKRPSATLAEWKRLCPEVEIIGLSGDPKAGAQVLAAGASQFISMGEPPDRLLDAVRAVSVRERSRERKTS